MVAPSDGRYQVVRAPRQLCLFKAVDQGPTLAFLDRIRRAALYGRRPVFIDLAACEHISSPACLALTVEIERCTALRPDLVINGRNPTAAKPQFTLNLYGFHRYLGLQAPRTPAFVSRVFKIRSGVGAEAQAAKDLADVADQATEIFGDAVFGNRVHAALNEALMNVLMHAYDRTLVDLRTCLPDRWWFAGLNDPEQKIGMFFAMDIGAGIPATSRLKMSLIEKFLAGMQGKRPAADHEVLMATIKERRSRTGNPQNAKGLPAMIGIVEQRAAKGSVIILSGLGGYTYANDPTVRTEPFEHSYPLPYRFPGTLVMWSVEGLSGSDVEAVIGEGGV